jgi:hypothetical protein
MVIDCSDSGNIRVVLNSSDGSMTAFYLEHTTDETHGTPSPENGHWKISDEVVDTVSIVIEASSETQVLDESEVSAGVIFMPVRKRLKHCGNSPGTAAPPPFVSGSTTGILFGSRIKAPSFGSSTTPFGSSNTSAIANTRLHLEVPQLTPCLLHYHFK